LLIKFFKTTERISKEDEFVQEVQKEEKFIEQEKAKYQGEDTSKQELNAEKLKIA
jgi:hypothetical protein